MIPSKPPQSVSLICAPVVVLGIGQIITWGVTYYLPAVLTENVRQETGWSLGVLMGAFSLALLTSGLLSPLTGKLLQRISGSLVLSSGVALCAVGLLLLAIAQNNWAYFLGWQVIGVGMAASLYGPAFATLEQVYGHRARSAITNVTLYAGFASSILWPVTHWLLQAMSWREVCITYALALFTVVIPLYLAVLLKLPCAPESACAQHERGKKTKLRSALTNENYLLFSVVAAVFTLLALITGTMAVYLISILKDQGASAAIAVFLAAAMGPSQVAARLLERLFAQKVHPLWILLASTLLVLLGALLMLIGNPVLGASVLFYGAGNGLSVIAMGTVPLVLFSSQLYPVFMGFILLPTLVAHAAAPSLGGILIKAGDTSTLLASLCALAVVSAVLSAGLISYVPRRSGDLKP